MNYVLLLMTVDDIDSYGWLQTSMEDVNNMYIAEVGGIKPTVELGQIVRSKQGRDRGSWYAVIGIEKTFLLLTDGRRRGVKNPKRKNIIHVQPVRRVAADLAAACIEGTMLRDEAVRAGIASLMNLPHEQTDTGEREVFK